MRAHCRLSCAVVARLAECSLRALLGEGGHEVGLSAEAISAIHTLDADADAELDADADAELDAELEAEGQRDEEEEAAATRAVPHQAAPPRAVRVAANDVHALRVAADGDVVSYEVEGYEEKTGIQIDELHADQVVHIQGGKKTVTTVHRKGKERERKELPRAQKDTAGAKGARGGRGEAEEPLTPDEQEYARYLAEELRRLFKRMPAARQVALLNKLAPDWRRLSHT